MMGVPERVFISRARSWGRDAGAPLVIMETSVDTTSMDERYTQGVFGGETEGSINRYASQSFSGIRERKRTGDLRWADS